jgi:hypothetical protein
MTWSLLRLLPGGTTGRGRRVSTEPAARLVLDRSNPATDRSRLALYFCLLHPSPITEAGPGCVDP